MKKTGNFEIIKSIKKECTEDIAIITCQVLYEGNCGFCEKAVIYYMPPYEPQVHLYDEHELTTEEKVAIQRALNKKFSKIQAKSIYDKIIKSIIY